MTDPALFYASILLNPNNKPKLLDAKFQKQSEFILHPARRKALFCTRRAAKSYTGGLYLIKTALEYDQVNCLYLGLTRESAKGIMWKDVFKTIDKRHALQLKYNETALTAETKNGSIIHATGVDADENEMEKLLGKKYKLIFIDEAASYTINLRRLVDGILGPALTDQRGTICLAGTSGNLTQGLFYDITTRNEPGWELFKWSAFDNPYVAREWRHELEEIEKQRPIFMQTPLFKQWYLNEWVVDHEKLVYRFDARNIYKTPPRLDRPGWSFVLGVDLGYSPDPSAFALAAFHEHENVLYFIETFKQTEMDITHVAEKIKEYQARYPIFRVVIDGSNKQAVQEMQNRHGLSLTPSEKQGKADFIQLMNAELLQAKVLFSSQTHDLQDEFAKLIWAMNGDKVALPRKENPNCSNHLTDATLYAWRYCYQYLSEKPKEFKTIKTRDEWVSHSTKLMQDRLEEDIAKEQAEESGRDFMHTSLMDDQSQVLSYYLKKRK